MKTPTERETMTKQPNEATLKPHHKAMQVVAEWMSEWGVTVISPHSRNPHHPTAFDDLHARFKVALPEEDTARGVMLGVCKRIRERLEEMRRQKSFPSLHLHTVLCVEMDLDYAIAVAKVAKGE